MMTILHSFSRKSILLFCALLTLTISLTAQTTIISGRVQGDQSGEPISGVEIRTPFEAAYTDPDGFFALRTSVSNASIVLTIDKDGYLSVDKSYQLNATGRMDVGVIKLKRQEDITQVDGEDIIPTVVLSNDQDTEGAQSISGILTASRDVFLSAAAYQFGPARFRVRGYDSQNTEVLMNGVRVNSIENGRPFWSLWGGLNDVTRNRSNSIGLNPAPFSFGGIGGASNIDTRASRQRKQIRASYASSNRTYTNRVMATVSTGLLDDGWAFTFSGSHRWAEEGWVPGTFYDAYSYFLSVDKQITEDHIVNLTFFGAPIKRGRGGASTQEMYDLADDNYYNPNWGYQNGEKRNARVANSHQPMVILRHDWNITDNTTLTTAASYQFGRNGSTAIDWYNAPDPRPDYYRKLPSFLEDEGQAAAVAELLSSNEAARQIDWDRMYNINYNSFETVENANGVAGNSVSGLRAQYILEERRFDSQTFNFNTYFESILNENLTINGGASYQAYKGRNFKVVDDLLGADFYLDVDKFAEFDSTDIEFIANDLDTPNRILEEGDVFGYDYEPNVRRIAAWFQTDWSFNRFDFFAGVQASQNQFWRESSIRNGKFPDSSSGRSAEGNFFDYGIKAGVTFKLDGRNYFVLNGAYMTRAPFLRNAFVSPRTRNDLFEGLTQEKIQTIEGGYILKAPYAKARVMGYFSRFQDQFFNRSFYLDNAIQDADGGTRGGFVNYLMSGIDTKHMGLELAGEVQVAPGLRLTAVAALGQYVYDNRPDVTVVVDNQGDAVKESTVYIENFRIPGTPQTAYTFGVNYSSPDYWFVYLNLNYFDNTYLDFFPERRTIEAVAVNGISDPQFAEQVVEPGSTLYNDIIDQQKAPGAFTLDFFGGKSWKIDDLFIYLNLGVSNILDKRDFITGGYEQFRFDFEDKNVDLFPNRLFYSFGRTYFASVAIRI